MASTADAATATSAAGASGTPHAALADAVSAPPPTAVFASSARDSTTALGAGQSLTPAPGAHPSGDGDLVDAITQTVTTPTVLMVTAAAAVTGVAVITAKSAASCAGGESRLIMTNVRLIPCLVKSKAIDGPAIALSGMRTGAAYATSLVSSGGATVGEHLSRAVTAARHGTTSAIVGPFREGFRQILEPRPGDGEEEADALSDGRLMIQIGMLVGLVYVGFLCLWFWLTRLRWNLR
jgi:hypothetical protein